MEDFEIHLVPDLDEKVAHMPEVVDAGFEAATKIADAARALAPVLSGDYEAGIEVQKTKSGARVLASSADSAFVEFGVPSQGQRAHFTLRRAVEAAGFKFKKRKG
jgi:hypothetical protein